jgi:hypothetical protein
VGSGADPLRMQIFFDHLAGLSGAAVEQDACAEVVRLVIAGECTHPLPPPAARAGKKVGSSPFMCTRKFHSTPLPRPTARGRRTGCTEQAGMKVQ